MPGLHAGAVMTTVPKRYSLPIRLAVTAAWLLTLVGGIGAIVLSPLTIVSKLGELLLYGCGAITALASLFAAFGVAANFYRIEWPASWFAASGLSPYVVTLWWLVFSGEWTRLTQACVVSAAILFMVSRALYCAAHAAKLRAIHSGETGGINVPH